MNEVRMYSNYKRKNKWLGIIDYSSLSILLVYSFGAVYILSHITLSIYIKVYIFAFLVIPVLTLFLSNTNEDSIIEVIITITKFIVTQKIYVKDYDYIKKNNPIEEGCIYVKNKDENNRKDSF